MSPKENKTSTEKRSWQAFSSARGYTCPVSTLARIVWGLLGLEQRHPLST